MHVIVQQISPSFQRSIRYASITYLLFFFSYHPFLISRAHLNCGDLLYRKPSNTVALPYSHNGSKRTILLTARAITTPTTTLRMVRCRMWSPYRRPSETANGYIAGSVQTLTARGNGKQPFSTLNGLSLKPNCLARNPSKRHMSRPRICLPCCLRRPKLVAPRKFDDQRRGLLTGTIPTAFIPPVVFLGLLIALWTYKCFMTVVFQEKIIYMPYMPPFTRSEKAEDYGKACAPVQWGEERIRSLDGTKLAICVGRISSQTFTSTTMDAPPFNHATSRSGERQKHIILCYFHGNGGSVPPRLPLISNVLKSIHSRLKAQDPALTNPKLTALALSYRGYWTSSGRASQAGIEQDATALLRHISQTYTDPNTEVEVILWGQSLGAGIACTAAASHLASKESLPITGLVLETPFVSIKRMLLALYPQKWLPYQYLHPFLRNHWDAEKALKRLAGFRGEHVKLPRVLIVAATRDEIVPGEQVGELEGCCQELGYGVRRVDVIGSLHNEATTRREGQEGVAGFVVQVASRGQQGR